MLDTITPLGFDIREPLNCHWESFWTHERRTKFLIRPEIQWPLSVDNMVWPSVAVSRMPAALNLWFSIGQILEVLPDLAFQNADSPVLIEIGAVHDDQSSQYWEDLVNGWPQPRGEYEIKTGVQELGYDIADRYLLSGLSNCMLDPTELAGIRRAFSQRINSFGLFDQVGHAADLRIVYNELIPEHAPFCVYRIRRINVAT